MDTTYKIPDESKLYFEYFSCESDLLKYHYDID